MKSAFPRDPTRLHSSGAPSCAVDRVGREFAIEEGVVTLCIDSTDEAVDNLNLGSVAGVAVLKRLESFLAGNVKRIEYGGDDAVSAVRAESCRQRSLGQPMGHTMLSHECAHTSC